MKKIISLILIFIVTFNLFSLTLILKNDNILNGNILKSNKDKIYFVRNSDPKTLLIIKKEMVSSAIEKEENITQKILIYEIDGKVKFNSYKEIIEVNLEYGPRSNLEMNLDYLQPNSQMANDYNQSFAMGMDNARISFSSGYGVGGFVSGLLLGIIGTGITYAIASGSSPQPLYIPKNVDQNGYRLGFAEGASKKNKSAALAGGLLGSLVSVSIFLLASSSN